MCNMTKTLNSCLKHVVGGFLRIDISCFSVDLVLSACFEIYNVEKIYSLSARNAIGA